MVKNNLDYSNTIIYKITCNDTNVSDLYVGHTTNFIERKRGHKYSCVNNKSSSYKCKLYEVIRNNGGWDNWNMEIINCFNCKDQYEARVKEQEYFVALNATLNSVEPMPTPKNTPIKVPENKENQTLHCEKCNIDFDNTQLLEIHNNTKEHIKLQHCIHCDFKCSKKSSYDKHLLSLKHKNRTNMENLQQNAENHNYPLIVCKNCNKKYASRVGLWKHKKNCDGNNNEINNEEINNNDHNNQITHELISSVLHQNKELQKMLMQQNKEFQQMLIEQNKIIIELLKNKC